MREYRDGDLDGAWYAIAATDDPHVNAAVVAEAETPPDLLRPRRHRRRGHRGDPGDVRATRGCPSGCWPAASTAARRRSGRPSARRCRQGVITPADDAPTSSRGGVALVGGGPGDPELITVRGRRLLAHADVVVADRLAPPELLAELPPHVEVIDAAKIPYGRAMAQDAINDVLIERARTGKLRRPPQGRRSVRLRARLRGGDRVRRRGDSGHRGAGCDECHSACPPWRAFRSPIGR